MQVAQDILVSASSSITSRAHSLRHFARFGAVAFGIVAGITASAGQVSARESAYKAALQERDAKIAELESANAMLKAPTTEKKSSGDPVQDWVDALAE